MLVRIMEHYSKFGFKEFYIAAGYKKNVIKKFSKINFKSGRLILLTQAKKP